jgi:hypothetical protein
MRTARKVNRLHREAEARMAAMEQMVGPRAARRAHRVPDTDHKIRQLTWQARRPPA